MSRPAPPATSRSKSHQAKSVSPKRRRSQRQFRRRREGGHPAAANPTIRHNHPFAESATIKCATCASPRDLPQATPASFLPCLRHAQNRFVYILRSDADTDRHYIGLTNDVERRLEWHNSGPSGVTVRHRPWSVVVSFEFADAAVAARFERYLKTGSGRAFATRHFGPAVGAPSE